MSDELRLFATTDAIYPNIKEVSSDDIIADSGITTSYFVVTVPPNTLTANITPISGITYTHYVITVDDSDTPTFPTDFTEGAVPLTKALADWTSEVWRLWVYDLPTTTGPTEINASDGTSGVTVTPVVGAPTKITDFAAVAGTLPETEIDVTFTASTAPLDGSTIFYDVVEISNADDTVINRRIRTNVSTSETVTDLTHDTNYKLAIAAYLAADVTKETLSNIVDIKTSAFDISIDSVIIDDAVDDYQAIISAFTSTGIDQYIVQIDDTTPPAVGDSWVNTSTITPGTTYIDFDGYDISSYQVSVWGRLSTDTGNITAINTQSVSVFTTDLIPDGGFSQAAAEGNDSAAFDAIYDTGSGGVFTRSNVDVFVANDIAYITNKTGAAGYLGMTLPVIEDTEYNIAFGEKDDLVGIVLDVDTSDLGTFNSGDLIAGQSISNATDTDSSVTITSGQNGGPTVIEAFSTDCTTGQFAATYPNWTVVDATASVSGGVVTLTSTHATNAGWIWYDQTVVSSTEYTFSVGTKYTVNVPQTIIALNSNTTDRDTYNTGDLKIAYEQNATMTTSQHVFTATSTHCYIGLWVNAPTNSAISFQSPTITGAGGGEDLYVTMWVDSAQNGNGYQLARVYGQPTGPSPPPIPPTPGDLLTVDFSNRSTGAYTEAMQHADFHWNENGWDDFNHVHDFCTIVADPLTSGRGNVLAVKRYAGEGWAGYAPDGDPRGGWMMKADFPVQEEVYFAFDSYLPSANELLKIMKYPGLMYGNTEMVGHPDVETIPTPAELQTFVCNLTLDGEAAWGRGGGSLILFYYDKETVQGHQFCDEVDPTFTIDWTNTAAGGQQYNHPKGYWITIEMRMKMNTVLVEGVSGAKDGIAEIWVTDASFNGGVVKKILQHDHRWRVSNQIKIDGLILVNFFGGIGSESENQPTNDQFHYYDNFRVSTTPITH